MKPHLRCIIRAPRFLWEVTKKILELKDWKSIEKFPDLMDALVDANPIFFKLLRDKKFNLSPKEELTLSKYLIRASTRSTPYGMLSGVGTGKLSKNFVVHKKGKSHRYQEIIPGLVSKKNLRSRQLHIKGNVATYYVRSPVAGWSLCQSELPALALKILSLSEKPLLPAQVVKLIRKTNRFSVAAIEAMISELRNESLLVSESLFKPFSYEHPIGSALITSNIVEEVPQQTLSCFTFTKAWEIPASLAQKSLKAAEVLDGIFYRKEQSALLRKVADFLEAQAPDATLPLLEIPVMNVTEDREQPELDVYFLSKIEELKLNQKGVWELSSEDDLRLRKISGHKIRREINSSVLVHISPDTENGFILTHVSTAKNSATIPASRFAVFDPKIKKEVEFIQTQEREGNSELAELDLIPTEDRHFNIMVRRSYFEKVISQQPIFLKTTKISGLSDIGVRRTPDGNISLFHLKNGHQITPALTQAYNWRIESQFHQRLLAEIANHQGQSHAWNWGLMVQSLNYLPRVVIAGVIVARARWKIQNMKDLEKLSAPRIGILVESGKRLRLDLEKEYAKKILASSLKNHGVCFIEESFPGDTESLEALFFGLPENQEKMPQSPAPVIRGRPILRNPDSQNFLYVKVYGNENLCNELLREIGNERAFFFVRFSDPMDHIRIRSEFKNGNEKENFRKRFIEIILKLEKGFGPIRYEYATYFPEVQRYGGKEGLAFFEKISKWDSQRALTYLQTNADEKVPIAIGISAGWLNLFQNPVDRISFLREVVGQNMQGKGLSFEVVQINPTEQIIKEFQTISQNWSPTDRKRFIGSVIHLSLNRLSRDFDKKKEYAVLKVLLKKQSWNH